MDGEVHRTRIQVLREINKYLEAKKKRSAEKPRVATLHENKEIIQGNQKNTDKPQKGT